MLFFIYIFIDLFIFIWGGGGLFCFVLYRDREIEKRIVLMSLYLCYRNHPKLELIPAPVLTKQITVVFCFVLAVNRIDKSIRVC